MHTNRYTSNNTSNTSTSAGHRDSGGSSSSSPSSNYSFYNLQMYSNTGSGSNTSNTSSMSNIHTHTHTHTYTNAHAQPTIPSNLYQNIQEVPYHHHTEAPLDHHRTPSPVITPRSSPNPSISIVQNTPTNTVHKNGITFVDPFTRTQQQQNLRHLTSQPLYATFGTDPIFVTCPYCHHTAETEVQQAVGSEALLWACLIPFAGLLLKSKWDTRHKCKNCLNVIGIHYPQ